MIKTARNLTILAAAGAVFAAPASAATVVSNVELTDPNTTPDGTVLCDFETATDKCLTSIDSGDAFSVQTGTSDFGAALLGSPVDNSYLSVPGLGFANGGSATINLAQFLGGQLSLFSIDWGSVDSYNTLTLVTTGTGADGFDTYEFFGSDITAPAPADGDQDSPDTNRRVTFQAEDGEFFTSMTLTSINSNGHVTQAFEMDNLTAVPEPSTWLMLILGLFGVGATMRRQKASQSASLAFS